MTSRAFSLCSTAWIATYTLRRHQMSCVAWQRLAQLIVRGVTREGHEGRAPPPPPKILTSVFRGSVERSLLPSAAAPFSWFLLTADLSWRPEDHFCKLFVIEMSPERHEKSEQRRPPGSWRPCAGVQPRSSVQLVTYHACQRSGTTCCSACDHLKESHDTAVKAQEKRPGQRDKVPSVPVSCGWFESCSCWFLERWSRDRMMRNWSH